MGVSKNLKSVLNLFEEHPEWGLSTVAKAIKKRVSKIDDDDTVDDYLSEIISAARQLQIACHMQSPKSFNYVLEFRPKSNGPIRYERVSIETQDISELTLQDGLQREFLEHGLMFGVVRYKPQEYRLRVVSAVDWVREGNWMQIRSAMPSEQANAEVSHNE